MKNLFFFSNIELYIVNHLTNEIETQFAHKETKKLIKGGLGQIK